MVQHGQPPRDEIAFAWPVSADRRSRGGRSSAVCQAGRDDDVSSQRTRPSRSSAPMCGATTGAAPGGTGRRGHLVWRPRRLPRGMRAARAGTCGRGRRSSCGRAVPPMRALRADAGDAPRRSSSRTRREPSPSPGCPGRRRPPRRGERPRRRRHRRAEGHERRLVRRRDDVEALREELPTALGDRPCVVVRDDGMTATRSRARRATARDRARANRRAPSTGVKVPSVA